MGQPGVDHRPFRSQVDVHRPVQAGVERYVRKEGLGASHHPGECRAVTGVEEARDRRSGTVEGVGQAAVDNAHVHLDRDESLLLSGVQVDVIDGGPLAVRQRLDAGGDDVLHVVLGLPEGGLDGVVAVLIDEAVDRLTVTEKLSPALLAPRPEEGLLERFSRLSGEAVLYLAREGQVLASAGELPARSIARQLRGVRDSEVTFRLGRWSVHARSVAASTAQHVVGNPPGWSGVCAAVTPPIPGTRRRRRSPTCCWWLRSNATTSPRRS